MKPAALAQEVDRASQQGYLLADTDGDDRTSSSRVLTIAQLPADIAASHTDETRLYSQCSCLRRPQFTAWGSPYGFLGIGTFSRVRHRRNCQWASFQRSFQYSVRYRFPSYFLRKAVHLSFSASYGAGGFSLAPTLGIISVATKANPAMEILNGCRHGRRYGCRLTVEEVISQLRALFVAGKASPFDIDEKGQNLSHVSHVIQISLESN